MVVDTTDRERVSALFVLKLLSDAAAAVACGGSSAEALHTLGDALRAATGSELVVLRTLDADGMLAQRAVSSAASALAAELEGTRVDPDDAAGELSEPRLLAPVARAAFELAGATAVLHVPALIGDRTVGVVELYRAGDAFGDEEREIARLGAAQLAVAVRLLDSRAEQAGRESLLELVGEALGAAADGIETPRQVARLAVEASGAVGALLWQSGPGEPVAVASAGPLDADPVASALAREALAERQPVGLHVVAGGTLATLRLGEPAGGILQLLFAEGDEPSAESVERLHRFAVRAAHALRASSRSRELTEELERGQALLEVVGEAIARLSLSHTLDTVVERICSLLGIERVAVYLDAGDGLVTAAQRGIEGTDGSVAARLLELAQGAYRARTAIVISQGDSDQAGAAARGALRRAGLQGAVALPLRSHDESIGLLAAYPPAGRLIAENEIALLSALAAQLAVAVQNARLHEQAMELGVALGASLESERSAARRLGALYEISASFVETLRLDRTLDAVARTVVELIDVDAAVVRVPDERGETLVPQAVHVTPGPFADAVRTILDRPHHSAVERASLLDAKSAQRIGGAHALLVPFLEKGSTAAVVPITSGKQLLAVLTVLSLDPARPITAATIDLLGSLARQAALAIDNARLYQQQQDFTDTIQRSLLPRSEPDLEGVQIGAVYESAATVDVGGDVYDFLELPDGRLAVVLGDVTGHGIGATADMAMAKYVFRSLVREHPEPGELLAFANDVVTGEVAVGKFVTMAVITFDPRTGKLVAASAGHPAPRLVRTGGRVEELAVGGLALGIDFGMSYEQASTTLEPGDAVVLFTDGVVEARLGRELYGVERLDETLASRWQLPARKLAEAVVKECRAFGGEISDDTAVVVVKRT
jgi:GAF domain-containing protein